jgi:hypothetical protein
MKFELTTILLLYLCHPIIGNAQNVDVDTTFVCTSEKLVDDTMRFDVDLLKSTLGAAKCIVIGYTSSFINMDINALDHLIIRNARKKGIQSQSHGLLLLY